FFFFFFFFFFVKFVCASFFFYKKKKKKSRGESFADVVARIKILKNASTNKDKEEKGEKENKIDIKEQWTDKWLDVYAEQFMKNISSISQIQNEMWNDNLVTTPDLILQQYNGMFHNADLGGLHQVLEWMEPSHFITKLIYLYQLHDWFASDPAVVTAVATCSKEMPFESGWLHWCNTLQTLLLAEKLFIYLVQLIAEPKFRACRNVYVKGSKSQSQQSQTQVESEMEQTRNKQWLEYEIVQWLALTKLTFSEMREKVSELGHVEDVAYQWVLKRVAHFEEPQGVQKARYRLRDDHYVFVDPYFHKYTTEDRQKVLSLLGTSWMGVMWTCILHHTFVNDTTRWTPNLFTYCLRLIALAVEAMWSRKLKKGEKIFDQCIRNLTTRFHFRLTDAFDHEQHKEVIRSKRIQRLQDTLRRFERETDLDGHVVDIEDIKQLLEDTVNSANKDFGQSDLIRQKYPELAEYLKQSNMHRPSLLLCQEKEYFEKEKDVILEKSRNQLRKLIEQDRVSRRNKMEPVASIVTPKNQQSSSSSSSSSSSNINVNTAVKDKSSNHVDLPRDVGTVVWYLCQILLRLPSASKNAVDTKEEDEKKEESASPKDLDSRSSETDIIIRTILSRCYDLDIPHLTESITQYWTPPQLLRKQDEIKRKTETEMNEKKQRAERAKVKAIKKIKQQKRLFEQRNSNAIIDDVEREEREQKDLLSSCGVGADYSCIICRLKENQHQMALIAFATGVQWTFCGHTVHVSCYDAYIVQMHDQFHFHYGRTTLRLTHDEFVCPYCK
ncbi:hypothetical protein RFI_18868, partial [Reticulomyxa filosa]